MEYLLILLWVLQFSSHLGLAAESDFVYENRADDVRKA